MEQETLKEAAEKSWRNDETMSDYVQQSYITGFMAGAKWQEEQDKQMQKEQIINAFDAGHRNGSWNFLGEEYYEKTFKNETK